MDTFTIIFISFIVLFAYAMFVPSGQLRMYRPLAYRFSKALDDKYIRALDAVSSGQLPCYMSSEIGSKCLFISVGNDVYWSSKNIGLWIGNYAYGYAVSVTSATSVDRRTSIKTAKRVRKLENYLVKHNLVNVKVKFNPDGSHTVVK